MAGDGILVEVWSDVVCPWCYIGKRRLEAAIARERPAAGVDVVWRSFELDPSAPLPGEPGHGQDVAEYLGQRYGGGREAGLAMSARVAVIAAEAGLAFDMAALRRGNTVTAHRLLHLAAEQGRQGALKERLLSGYFSERLDIADLDVLRELAAEVGLDAVRVGDVLGSDEFAEQVAADIAQARAYGATGVPFVVVDGRYGISGAQPVDMFAEALHRAQADRSAVDVGGVH